ncbi:MAG: GNAT family N-acetyltransferase [Pseudomonadota bacterium]
MSLCTGDLAALNAVIRSAVDSWVVPARMKRLAVPVLEYDATDLSHFRAVGAFVSSETGVASDTDSAAVASILAGVALWDERQLHGLYVRSAWQGWGIGRRLLEFVRLEAGQAGSDRLLVKAQRVSASFFEGRGLERAEVGAAYPYSFYLATGGVGRGA